MGRALVIKNVDFSTNKLDTVTYDDPIPCESIELDQSTITVSEIGDTVTLTATVLPADTTDTVVWVSSDTNVAEVNGGVVTVKGIGTATITAKCGNQTATASVNQTSLQFTDIVTVSGVKASESQSVLWLYGNSGDATIGKAYTNASDLRVFSAAANSLEAIPVPYGATSVLILSSERKFWGDLRLADMDDLVSYNNQDYPKALASYSGFYTDVPKAVEYGQCMILSASADKVALVSGLQFQ